MRYEGGQDCTCISEFFEESISVSFRISRAISRGFRVADEGRMGMIGSSPYSLLISCTFVEALDMLSGSFRRDACIEQLDNRSCYYKRPQYRCSCPTNDSSFAGPFLAMKRIRSSSARKPQASRSCSLRIQRDPTTAPMTSAQALE